MEIPIEEESIKASMVRTTTDYEDYSVWTRTDYDALFYKSTSLSGPTMNRVCRRVTTDLDNGNVVQDVDDVYMSEHGVNGQLPFGVCNICTVFYYM